MQIACGGVTDVGRVRTNNEDCFRIITPLNLYVLADGMGGEAPFHGFEKWQRAAPPLREHREEWPEEKSEHRRGPQSILEGWQERRFLRASLFRFLRFQIGAPPPCFL